MYKSNGSLMAILAFAPLVAFFFADSGFRSNLPNVLYLIGAALSFPSTSSGPSSSIGRNGQAWNPTSGAVRPEWTGITPGSLGISPLRWRVGAGGAGLRGGAVLLHQ